MEELNQEPDYSKIPPAFEDLAEDNRIALTIHGKLGNRVFGDVGYTGKDYTNLPILIEIYNIIDKELLLDKLNIIDGFYIDKTQKQIKKQHDDMKKKIK